MVSLRKSLQQKLEGDEGLSDSGIYGKNVPGRGKIKCEVLRGAILLQYLELLGLHCSGTGVGKAGIWIGHKVRELQESDHVGYCRSL